MTDHNDLKKDNTDSKDDDKKENTIKEVKEKDTNDPQSKTVDSITSVIKDTKTVKSETLSKIDYISSKDIKDTEVIHDDKSSKDIKDTEVRNDAADALTVTEGSSSIVSRILNENTSMTLTSQDHQSGKENVR